MLKEQIRNNHCQYGKTSIPELYYQIIDSASPPLNPNPEYLLDLSSTLQ